MKKYGKLLLGMAGLVGTGVGGWYLATRAKTMAKTMVKKVVTRKQTFSIAIYSGDSPLNIAPTPSTRRCGPALRAHHISDTWADFVADPFMVRVVVGDSPRWYMFFEIWNERTRCASIGLATSENGDEWQYAGVVLREPFHLSYPQVFPWEGQWYMVPESAEAGAVRLYRADDFPRGWSLVGTLLNGSDFLDPTLFIHDHRWWMLVTRDSHPDNLYLFSADTLRGPWVEHPQSPVVRGNMHYARPAGRVVWLEGRPVRFAQDCASHYGLQVYALEITRLDPTHYEERLLRDGPILQGSGYGWNARGMHHIDALQREDGQWIACVDGWRKYPYVLDRNITRR